MGGVSVEIMRKINGGDVDWALGAAIIQILESRTAGASSLPFSTDSVADIRVVGLVVVVCALVSLLLGRSAGRQRLRNMLFSAGIAAAPNALLNTRTFKTSP